MSEITDLSIEGVDLSGVASKEHTHVMSDITDLDFPETDLSNVAEKDHTHTMSDIIDLTFPETDLSGKADVDHNHDNTYAALSHMHEISEVNNLQDTLDSKADTRHTHTMSDITDLSLDGIDLSNVASKDHTHTQSVITDLTISDSLYKYEYSIALSEGTEYFTVTMEQSNETPVIYLYSTDTFKNANISSIKFIVEGYDYIPVLAYDSGEFRNDFYEPLSSLAIIVNNNELALYINGPVYPINTTLTITDFNNTLLSKFTIAQSEVNSSTIITSGAIDETYVKKTEYNDHSHTKNEITDLTVSDSIYGDFYTYTLKEDTEFFSIEYDGSSMTFNKTDNFDADLLGSQFNIIIGNVRTLGVSIYNEQGHMSVISGSGVASDSVSAPYLDDITFPLTVTITDSSDNVLSIYTVTQSEVDSSNLLTFGAIDEAYAMKAEIESLQLLIEELTSRIAALESNT